MGTFSNTNINPASKIINNQTVYNREDSLRKSVIQNMTESMINRIVDNPFYFFNNMNMTKVTFYNIDKDYTTLDETLENTNNLIGHASGLRFDKINNCILLGMPRIELNVNVGEFGTEADLIEGEAILPPNTFKPYQESYFLIDYLQTAKKLWFRVNTVNQDTLPNGANFYKINYHLEAVGKDINPQVVKEYNFIAENIGTPYPVLVDAEAYALMNMYQELISMLQSFYYEMFFKQEVQTFVFRYGPFGYFFYDPYMLNFAIRNGLLSSNGKDYVHVAQPAMEPPMMNIDYEHTIFKRFEDFNSKLCFYDAIGMLVQDPMSLLTQRIEPYYMVTFRDDTGYPQLDNPLLEKIQYFDTDLTNLFPGLSPFPKEEYACKCAEILFNLDKSRAYYEIIYTFLNGGTVTSTMLEKIKYMCFSPCKELYYTIPILIYIIRATMRSLGV